VLVLLLVMVSWYLECFSPSIQSLVCRGYQGRSFACCKAEVSWCRCCGASLFQAALSITISCHAGVGISLRRRWIFLAALSSSQSASSLWLLSLWLLSL
jgi:hypothetical protein